MANSIEQLGEYGQSVWLDYIRRGLIISGELARMVSRGWIRGVTSNPTIFQKAIAGSHDYDDALTALAGRRGLSRYEAYLEIAGEDIRLAADALRPVYDSTNGRDGFVSFEAQAGGTEEMFVEAKRMFALVGRPNVMIKIPGVGEGVEAARRLIADGLNVNVTLLFDVDVYSRFAEAYISGLEERLADGRPIDRIGSVASFFVSRVDTKVDEMLPDGSPLRGMVAIANARSAYALFRQIFSGPRWEGLAAAGASVQRPLWASTGTKNPAYSDVLYVEQLVAPDTVNTMPEVTLNAFLDHGRARPAVEEKLAEAARVIEQAAEAGIDMKAATAELLDEGLASFQRDFDKLLEVIGERIGTPAVAALQLPSGGPLAQQVANRLQTMKRDDVLRRIWAGDHTVWKDDASEITRPNRLGWLTIPELMLEQAPRLQSFAKEVRADGYTTAVLLGMGGSSLAAEVLFKTFGAQGNGLVLKVLDTTVPADILALDESIDLDKTLFIAASKSGTTIETRSHLDYFWARKPVGSQFVAITDAGTPLESLARERHFGKVFLNPDTLGGRYSALSYFGLVPAALIGLDLRELLETALEAQCACHHCLPPTDNPGAMLGVALGEAALADRDKLTLLLPEAIAGFGDWIEQLIAESTGKEGKGIIPVIGEPIGPPAVYADDRLFVALGDHAGLDALEAAGHPVLRLPFEGRHKLGAEFYRWEFAVAVAGYVLGINPFDQPDVEQAKEATRRVLEERAGSSGQTGDVAAVLARIGRHDYVAIQAYLPQTAAVRSRLADLRLKLRDRYQVATTLGFGPRYLHSTGQIHKGGPNEGVFLQIVEDAAQDVAIPGQPFTFGALNAAQAEGDLQALVAAGRRVVRTRLADVEASVK